MQTVNCCLCSAERSATFSCRIICRKKVGNAVKRNEIKRKIRASLTDMQPRIKPTLDFIVIARPSVSNCSSQEVYSNLEHVLKLAKIIN